METIDTLQLPKEFELQLQDFKDIQTEGIIDIIPINQKKFEEVTFSQFKPANQNITFGVPLEVYKDRDGQTRVKFKRIKITGYTTYDLSIRSQAIEFAVVKNHPTMEGSPFQRGEPLLQVFNRETEADRGYDTIRKSMDALEIALDMGEEELVDFSRNLGISPEAQSLKVLKFKVAEIAQKKPKEFTEAYKHTDRGILSVVKRAEAFALISHDTEKGYLYKKGFRLGHTMAAVILTLKRDRELLSTIDYDSKEMSKYKYERKKQSNGQEDEKPMVVDKELSKPNQKIELSIEELRVIGKTKKIKGYHLMGIETLNTKIKEAEKIEKTNVMNAGEFSEDITIDKENTEDSELREQVIKEAKECGIEHVNIKPTDSLQKEIKTIRDVQDNQKNAQ